MTEADAQPAVAPHNAGRRMTMALLAVAGVFLVALGVAYQPFSSEPEAASFKYVQKNINEKVELTIDSATGTVEDETGEELRHLLSLVERERKETRGDSVNRKLNSKSEDVEVEVDVDIDVDGKGKGKGNTPTAPPTNKGSKSSGKGDDSKDSKGSKKGKSEMPTSAPTTTPMPSRSQEPTAMPSELPTIEGSAPTNSPEPSASLEPTFAKSAKGSNKGSEKKADKGSKSSGKGKGDDKSGKNSRERDLLEEDMAFTESQIFKTGRRQV